MKKFRLILKHKCVMAISEATAVSEWMLSGMKRLKTITGIANCMHANAQLPRPSDIQHID